MSTEIAFDYDADSLALHRRITARGGHSSMGVALRESIVVQEALQDAVLEGFTELLVRKPETLSSFFLDTPRREKEIIVPSLQRLARKAFG